MAIKGYCGCTDLCDEPDEPDNPGPQSNQRKPWEEAQPVELMHVPSQHTLQPEPGQRTPINMTEPGPAVPVQVPMATTGSSPVAPTQPESLESKNYPANDPLRLYEILGIGRNASEGEIDEAYRRELQKLRDEEVAAKEKSTHISTAIAVLGDSTRRSQYDTHGTICGVPLQVPMGMTGSSPVAPTQQESSEESQNNPANDPLRLYGILGIGRNASEGEIDEAYRRELQKLCDEEVAAKEKSIHISTANAVLRDSTRRSQYDTHGTIDD